MYLTYCCYSIKASGHQDKPVKYQCEGSVARPSHYPNLISAKLSTESETVDRLVNVILKYNSHVLREPPSHKSSLVCPYHKILVIMQSNHSVVTFHNRVKSWLQRMHLLDCMLRTARTCNALVGNIRLKRRVSVSEHCCRGGS